MAFSVTPDTTVSEAAMFHGARVTLEAQSALSAGFNTVPFDTVHYDTDGFWNSGTSHFDIPEGVSYVRLTAGLGGFGTSTPVDVRARIQTSGGTQWVAQNGSNNALGAVTLSMDTGVIPVSAGDSIRVQIREDSSTSFSLKTGGSAVYPNFFCLEVIKNPFGHPASPTLP